MRGKRAALIASALCLCALAIAPSGALGASESPAWSITATQLPANLAPGGKGEVLVLVTNVGAKEILSAPYAVQVKLPVGLKPQDGAKEKERSSGKNSDPRSAKPTCTTDVPTRTVTCETSEPLGPGRYLLINVKLEAEAIAEGSLDVEASVSGGGGAEAATTLPLAIQAGPVPFGFLPGFAAPANNADGTPAALAGSHPYQQSVQFGFPTKNPGEGNNLTNDGHPRNFSVELPRGWLANPAATGVLCTEAQLTSESCPTGSQVGLVDVTTLLGEAGSNSVFTSALYNMVPPPGSVASLATSVANGGIFVHVLASLRSDSDYGVSALTADTLAFGTQPIFAIQTQLWGDPSAPAHEQIRGKCALKVGTCEAPPIRVPFLTVPGSCPAAPLAYEALSDSWEDPSPPAAKQSAHYSAADLQGNPLTLAGCNAIDYQPTIEARPTTSLADSPSGLRFDLRQPQQPLVAQDTDPLAGRATGELKDARVTLPAGIAVNPSQAAGLQACGEAEIGYLGEGHYSKAPQSCPDASKLGTMEVSSPLLAQTEEGGTKIATDPETGEAIPRPLQGSVFLAKPYENQFGSLLAIYLAIEDHRTGIVSKLAGRVEADPQSGQLTTVFEENPELPLSDIHLSLFGGSRGALISPQICGAHTTVSDLTPWSAPEGLDAHPTDSFQTTVEPGGGCPGSEGAAANKPAFQAGTIAPQAGAFSPFVLKLAREDGSQRIAGIDTTLPPGLSGKLAGIAQCSEAQIAQAKAREKPDEGILERQSPSCPASSEVGSVDVAAGAGPTPFHTSGHAYLAGPYKGAPLSLVAIVPAVAGPFDLGAVVSRVALYVDPDTAQIHAVSDPLPQILEGIPLDVRSIALTMGRPQFTLNPTSCDPMSITGSATSALGQSAALSNPFQVGGCPQLPFKPKLSLKLKGGTKRTDHPKLIANLKAKGGEANVASAQVKLPPSAFLDQAHIRTVCTRVQFAANACPQGSIYGTATAITPLLSDPLSGNVYLRSSSHKLPDLLVALKGPASLPIEIDLDGRTDSVKGALRNTFEAVPDAPVSSFRLELFGGKRGLVVNSRNLCAHPYKAEVNLSGQNGKVFDSEPVVGTGCKGHKKRRHKHR